MDYFPPVAAEHVIILMMLSHAKRNVYGVVRSGQVRSGQVQCLGRR